MFADFSKPLTAELIALQPSTLAQETAAARAVARQAQDKDDLLRLLEVLGLPTDENTTAPLLPYLPTTDPIGGKPAMQETNAYEAVALSMHEAGDSADKITQATGLDEEELAALIERTHRPTATLSTPAQSQQPGTTPPIGIENLLAWAEHHTAASIRNRAARIRADITELRSRHASEQVTREAEERVARAKAELEAAMADLRTVKASGRTSTAESVTEPTPMLRRSKEQLAAIRTWARANGHTVADQGMIPKKIVAAYDAAHRAPQALAAAG
ncbi:Lsr2 family DNA-binding protein [Streptomyces abikoensis]|uniref:Histone-like nucleoid-structuring protein Lsr2 n=1 Tax=Streptomyces abikoensis TaxID=97398 RepID=A0ABW7TGH1_9ACTN